MLEGRTPPDARGLAARQARPWFQLLRQQDEASDHALSRLPLVPLGVPGMAAAPDRDTRDLVADVVFGGFAGHGIDAVDLVPDNGSGLSRSARVSARRPAQGLVVAHRRPYAADLIAVSSARQPGLP